MYSNITAILWTSKLRMAQNLKIHHPEKKKLLSNEFPQLFMSFLLIAQDFKTSFIEVSQE